MPERFPPSIWWIIGPAMGLYGYYLLSRLMERYPAPFAPLEAMGRNVLWFLVMSNVLIFTLKNSQQNYLTDTTESFEMTVVFLAIAGFAVWIITKPQRSKKT